MAHAEGAAGPAPASLEASRLGLGRLFDRARDAVVVGEAKSGHVVLWNAAAVRIFGYEQDEACELLLEDLVPDRLKARHRAGLRAFAETGTGALVDSGEPVQLPARRKDGTEIHVELTLSPIDQHDLPGRYVMAIVRDVSERVRTLEELRAAHEEIRMFAAVAAHELSNPLSIVLGFTFLLRSGWDVMDEERKKELLEGIGRQAERLSVLADDLLTISRIESGAVGPQPEVLSLAETIRDVSRDLDGTIGVSAPEALCALADPEHLRRILTNYLHNAFKHGAPPIEVRARADGPWAEIRVSDRGDGVPEELMPRLFGRFVRAKHPRGSRPSGTGLGLSIVRGLARANGGEAWFEPNRPRGSVFCVRLPRAGG